LVTEYRPANLNASIATSHEDTESRSDNQVTLPCLRAYVARTLEQRPT
jgi:hypothetical protein